MKKYCFVSIFLLATTPLFAQISPADSTVQVIGFWEKNEKQRYDITTQKINLTGPDTTNIETIKYEVEISIIDSTEKSYTIEWFYRNFSIDTDNLLTQKLASISQDMKVLIKTDELGAFVEVVNWEEVRDFIKAGISGMKAAFNNLTAIDKILQQVEDTYATKAAIESAAIRDVQQFYTFHGGRYQKGELIEGRLKVHNLVGPEPFDAELTVYLDEINIEENTYLLRASEVVDAEQLTEATWNYLVNLSRSSGGPLLKREELKGLKNETLTASRIHGTGWVIYSVQTKTVSFEDDMQVEERVIELK